MSGFKLGDLILTSQPFVYVLNNAYRGKRCDYCFKKREGLKLCTQCTFLYFCDRNCQEKAWDFHKLECKRIKKAKPEEPTGTMRFVALVLLTLKRQGEENPCENVYKRKVTFKTLMSHAEDIEQNLKACQQSMALIRTLRTYVGQSNLPLPSHFMEIFGKVSINTFTICDGEMQNIGTGLYLGASVFDHSCQPDAEVMFDGISLHIRAVKDIPHKDISKISISYIDQLDLNETRQKALKEQYYFTCKCSRCSSSEYDDLMSHILVPEEEAKGELKRMREAVQTLKEMKADKNIGPSTLYTACVKELAAQEDVLGDSHILKVKTLEIAFDACIENNQWTDAGVIGKKLLKPYRLYYGPYHPQLGIYLFRVGKIEVFLNLTTATKTLEEAQNVLRVTHGEEHPLYKDLLKSMDEAKILTQLPESVTEVISLMSQLSNT